MPLKRVGWHKSSLAYTSPGHRRYNQPFTPTAYGPEYVQGDVIGVGYRPRTGTVFFTRNGKKLDDVTHGLKSQNFFPTVGAQGPSTVHVNFGQSGFVFIEANVKKWGLAPTTGSLAPPPPYGSEQGSILLEAGRDGAQRNQGSYNTAAHARSRSGNTRFGPPQSPGPVRSPTEISLAHLAHIPSHEDVGEGTSRSVGGALESAIHPSEVARHPSAMQEGYEELPPEYTSPEGSTRRRDSDETDDGRRPLMQSGQSSPPVPSYDVAVGNEPERRRDEHDTRGR